MNSPIQQNTPTQATQPIDFSIDQSLDQDHDAQQVHSESIPNQVIARISQVSSSIQTAGFTPLQSPAVVLSPSRLFPVLPVPVPIHRREMRISTSACTI